MWVCCCPALACTRSASVQRMEDVGTPCPVFLVCLSMLGVPFIFFFFFLRARARDKSFDSFHLSLPIFWRNFVLLNILFRLDEERYCTDVATAVPFAGARACAVVYVRGRGQEERESTRSNHYPMRYRSLCIRFCVSYSFRLAYVKLEFSVGIGKVVCASVKKKKEKKNESWKKVTRVYTTPMPLYS